MKKLPRSFYERNTLTVAWEMLGKLLVHDSPDGRTVGRIVEDEAYVGPGDRACHAYGGLRTRRTEVMFGAGGVAYVFRIYGVYNCFNVTTEKPGIPAVVLIRALEPVDGLEIMGRRRGVTDLKPAGIRRLCSGPGKLCQAMGITTDLSGEDLCGNRLFLLDEGEMPSASRVARTKRINIDYAGEAADYPWRFLFAACPYVSVPLAKSSSPPPIP